jgi:AcrR family transcriptional regulator
VNVRKRLTEKDVVDAAATLVEAEGTSALTLTRVAQELNIKPPSLYNHVAGLETLRRHVALQATEDLGAQLGAAAMGRAGRSALHAIAAEFRTYVAKHPGLYELSAQARPDDEEFTRAAMLSTEPVIAILRSFDLDADNTIHAARTIRAALHGFVSLEIMGGFGLDVDIDQSFEWLIESLADTLDMPKTPNRET